MEKRRRRRRGRRGGGRPGGGGELIERLPHSVLLEILASLDLESLCSAAPVCRTFCSLVSQALSSVSTLDLSHLTPNEEILHRLLRDNKTVRSLTLDCRMLDDSSIKTICGGHLQELVLLKGRHLSSLVLLTVAEICPNLRIFKLEASIHSDIGTVQGWKTSLAGFLKVCQFLETFWLKIHGEDLNGVILETFQFILPRAMKDLLLQPISEPQARTLLLRTLVNENSRESSTSSEIARHLEETDFKLRSLSLVLNNITDALLLSIVSNLHLLSELCLEDRPLEEPPLHQDMTNNGLQLLGSFRKLTFLSLTRNRQYCSTTFKRVNDMGMFLLAEGCKSLESIRLGGFSRITDAGYISILHACKNLKTYEIVNAFFLSDLAFHNLAEAPCSLVDLKLISCSLLTCETAGSLSLSESLEVLDLSGCKSIGDQGLASISILCNLTTLDLSGADITDSGLKALGGGSSPITSLNIRGCKRVTDRGVVSLLLGDGVISQTLSSFDLGFIAGITDRAMFTIAEVCKELRELCVRSCFYITDASIEALASATDFDGKRKRLRMLDLYQCTGLSPKSYKMLSGPSFHSLRWLGVGRTSPSQRCINEFSETLKERPWITVCFSGCERGCKDGWQIHGYI